MFLGLDIGSASSKAVILSGDGQIAAKTVVNTGTGTRGPDKAVEKALLDAGLTASQIVYSVVTGYGRINYSFADKQITEISCHAKGVAHLNPNARTVIDIGGQDAKVIRLINNGKLDNFVMNDKCAAGTGRFLEVMARILDCGIGELSGLAERSTEAVVISNTCTVFAESEVISRLAAGSQKGRCRQRGSCGGGETGCRFGKPHRGKTRGRYDRRSCTKFQRGGSLGKGDRREGFCCGESSGYRGFGRGLVCNGVIR